MSNNTTTRDPEKTKKYVLAAMFIAVAFFASYRFSAARNGGVAVAGGAQQAFLGATQGAASGGNGGVGGGGCCGGGGAPVEGTATLEGNTQKITVSAAGGFNPNVIKLKAGVPAEIKFTDGGGCTSQVFSDELKFSEDLSGGPRTVKLPALKAGTYNFSCGMQMVFGQIVVS